MRRPSLKTHVYWGYVGRVVPVIGAQARANDAQASAIDPQARASAIACARVETPSFAKIVLT